MTFRTQALMTCDIFSYSPESIFACIQASISGRTTTWTALFLYFPVMLSLSLQSRKRLCAHVQSEIARA